MNPFTYSLVERMNLDRHFCHEVASTFIPFLLRNPIYRVIRHESFMKNSDWVRRADLGEKMTSILCFLQVCRVLTRPNLIALPQFMPKPGKRFPAVIEQFSA